MPPLVTKKREVAVLRVKRQVLNRAHRIGIKIEIVGLVGASGFISVCLAFDILRDTMQIVRKVMPTKWIRLSFSEKRQ